jgi:hypothetical protein
VHPWPLEEWRDHYPYWNEPNILAREKLGNCYAMIADTILTLEAPYPGDERFNSACLRPELRFHVYQNGLSIYVVKDRLTGERLEVARQLLGNPKFDISNWYAER